MYYVEISITDSIVLLEELTVAHLGKIFLFIHDARPYITVSSSTLLKHPESQESSRHLSLH